MVPSLEGLEGFLGLRGPRGPVPGPLPPWWGSCLNREPGEGAPELQGEQKGIMVARMRARQSATSLLGAQARAGVRPEVERQRGRKKERERGSERRAGTEGRKEEEEEEESERRGRGGEAGAEDKGGTEQHSISVQPADTVCNMRGGAQNTQTTADVCHHKYSQHKANKQSSHCHPEVKLHDVRTFYHLGNR